MGLGWPGMECAKCSCLTMTSSKKTLWLKLSRPVSWPVSISTEKLSGGADVDRQLRGLTALHNSCRQGQLAVCPSLPKTLKTKTKKH